MDDRLTEGQLRDAAARQGCKVTAEQLKRWRRAGLIPRPSQDHVAGARGSRSTYPAGTLRQLLDVARLHVEFRQLERVRFELWWTGRYHGDLALVRVFLVQRLDRLLSPLRAHRDRYDDPLDAAEAAIDDFASRDPVIRAMKRMARTDSDFRSGVIAVLMDLFGGEVDWDPADPSLESGEPSLRQLVERITGVERAKSDPTEAGSPLVAHSANVVDAIQAIHRSGAIDLDHPGRAIQSASDQALTEAAATSRLLLGLISYARVSTLRRGRDHAGLSVLGWQDISDPTLIALALQFTLHLPSLLDTPDEQDNAAGVLDALSQHQAGVKCIEDFCKEHPGYAFIFKTGGPERAQALPEEERKLLRQTIDQFLVKHPACAALMAAGR